MAESNTRARRILGGIVGIPLLEEVRVFKCRIMYGGRAERRTTPTHSAMSGVVSNPVAQVCRVVAFDSPDELQLDVVAVPCLEQSAASA
jgi:hypothetical protein